MPKEKTLIREDKKYIWHPFTQMADWQNDSPSPPIVIKSGKGNYLYDTTGKKYLDGISSLWVTLHGHNHNILNSAVKRQLSKVAHSTFLGLTHEPAIKLAKLLTKISPLGLSRVFYSDNGSTAVEVALKMAYQYWKQKDKSSKRNTFLSLTNAYHGDTLGSVSVGGMTLFHSIFKHLLFKSIFAPSPYCYRCPHRWQRKENREKRTGDRDFGAHCAAAGCKGQCIKEVENILKKKSKSIAAAIVEPMVQGAAGILTMPPGYMKEFEKLCRKYGILLICDEVATGFGRTGKMFACEIEGIKPDLMCVAKGITGGYLPLAATLARENIYKAFLGKHEDFKTFFHGHTYTANPLACAAAIANLGIFNSENTLKKAKPKIAHMANELKGLYKIPFVGDIRQLGLMAGIEVVKDASTMEDFPAKEKFGARVCAECRKDGIILRPLGNVIVLMPPLSITKSEITRIISAIKKAMLKLT